MAEVLVWCGGHEPHGRHEWLKGVRRMDCPGLDEHAANSLLRSLNHARSCLRDAEDEATHGLTANARLIDQRVTEAREAIDRAILCVVRGNPEQ